MRNLLLTFTAFFLTFSQLQAQADSIAKATVQISAKNDSTYAIQVSVNVQAGWKVYDANEEGQITGMKLSAYSTAEGESDMIQTLNFSQELLSDMSDQEGQVWGWSWAEALWDHKAITVSVEHGIFAFAVNAYSYHIVEDIVTEENEDGDIKTDVYYDYTFTYHSYYFVFKIDFNQEEPISLIEKVEHPSSDLGYVQVDRGVMINQVIHTLSNQQMISYDFTSDSILQTLVFPEYQQA